MDQFPTGLRVSLDGYFDVEKLAAAHRAEPTSAIWVRPVIGIAD